MTSKLTPALYRGRSLEQQWLNNIYGSHDLFCGCPDPIKHLQEILKPRNQQLCLPGPSEQDGGEKDQEDIGLEEGDLDLLFKEPFTEEDEEG